MSVKVYLIQNIVAPYRVPLFRRLAEDPDIDLTVLQLAASEPNRREWEQSDTYSFRMKRLAGFRYARSYEDQVRFNPLLAVELLTARPAVIIISGFSFASLVAVLLKPLLGCRIVLWFEGTQYSETGISGFRMRMRRFISGRVDAALFPGEMTATYAREVLGIHAPVPIHTAYNSIDNVAYESRIRSLRDSGEAASLKKRYGDRVLLSVGQLVERKGVWDLLRAYESLQTQAALIILGSGPLDRSLKEYCLSRRLYDIHFLGFVPQHEILQYYAITDIFVLLSHYDCNPLVIFESLASGLPIVASYQVGNTPEFVRSGENGFVVDGTRAHEVSGKLDLLLTADTMRIQFGQKSLALSKKATYEQACTAFRGAILSKFDIGKQRAHGKAKSAELMR